MLFHPNLPEPFSKEDPLRKKRRKDASVPLDPGMIKDLEDKKPSPFEPLSAPRTSKEHEEQACDHQNHGENYSGGWCCPSWR